MRYARFAFTLFLLAVGLAISPSAEAQVVAPCKSLKLTNQTVGTSAANYTGGTASTVNTTGGGRFNSLGQLAGRMYLTVCHSKETTSTTALLRVLVAGIPSAYLAWGDCISLPVGEQLVPQLISSEASTKAAVFECSSTP